MHYKSVVYIALCFCSVCPETRPAVETAKGIDCCTTTEATPAEMGEEKAGRLFFRVPIPSILYGRSKGKDVVVILHDLLF